MFYFSYICIHTMFRKFIENYTISLASTNQKLNPWYITGYADAESCFNIHLVKNSTNLIGWQVQARFILEVNLKDLDSLYKIQTFFNGIGSISVTKKVARYSIQGINDIVNIVNHFDKYCLQSSKQIDFALWKQCVEIILNKKHLTQQGLEKIVSYKSAINYSGQSPRSNILKLLFPNSANIKRPVVEIRETKLNPFWVTGFIAGEGSFYINTNKITKKMRPVFSMGLNERDKFLLLKINDF